MLRPGGLLAVWSYGRRTLEPASFRPTFDHFYDHTIGPHWTPERELAETGYRSITLPFVEIDAPHMTLTAHWDIARLCRYMRSWSATQRHIDVKGNNPIDGFRATLNGPDDTSITLHWPLMLRAARKP